MRTWSPSQDWNAWRLIYTRRNAAKKESTAQAGLPGNLLVRQACASFPRTFGAAVLRGPGGAVRAAARHRPPLHGFAGAAGRLHAPQGRPAVARSGNLRHAGLLPVVPRFAREDP